MSILYCGRFVGAEWTATFLHKSDIPERCETFLHNMRANCDIPWCGDVLSTDRRRLSLALPFRNQFGGVGLI